MTTREALPVRVTQLVETHVAALALLAQGFAAAPTPTIRGDTPPSPATHNLRLAILSSFYSYALRQGLLQGSNPIARVERVKTQAYAHAQGLAQETLVAALDAIPRETPAGLRDYALLLIGLYTGRRLAELAAMAREHVTIHRTAVEIIWPRCKGGRVMRDMLARRGQQALPAQALLAWLAWLDHPSDNEASFAVIPHEPDLPEHPIWISLARNGTWGHRLSLPKARKAAVP